MLSVDIIPTIISSKEILTWDQIKKLTLSDKISKDSIPILNLKLKDRCVIIKLDGVKRFAKYVWYEQHDLDEMNTSSFLNKYTPVILEYFGVFRDTDDNVYLIMELIEEKFMKIIID